MPKIIINKIEAGKEMIDTAINLIFDKNNKSFVSKWVELHKKYFVELSRNL